MTFTAQSVFSFEDYKAVYRAMWFRSRLGHWVLHIYLIGLVLFFFCFGLVIRGLSPEPGLDWHSLPAELLGLFIACAPVFLLWELAWRLALFARLTYKKCSPAGQAVTCRLDDNGVSWSAAGIRCAYDWPLIGSVTVTGNAIVAAVKGVQAIVFPERAFASRQEFEAAANFALAQFAATRGASSVASPQLDEGAPALATVKMTFLFEDYKALHRAAIAQGRFGRWTPQVWLLAWMLLIFFLLNINRGFSLHEGPDWQGLGLEMLTYFVLMAPALLFLWLLPVVRLRTLFRSCAVRGKAMTYRLDGKGVSWETAGMRGKYEWPAIGSVTVIKNAIVLVTTATRQGIVLPLRAFASRQEFEAAADFALAHAPANKTAPSA